MVNLFFSYSHADESLRNELEKHLATLKRNNIISTWHDRRINPGENFSSVISDNLKKANIILLLVSPDFIHSDYCYEIEMKEALKRHAEKDAVVIPVILRPCDWQDAPFGSLLALPTDGKPVTVFRSFDEAFLDITKGIKSVINGMSKEMKDVTPAPSHPIFQGSTTGRSSNLAITRNFTDHEKDKFLQEAFRYIINYFEESLEELKRRNPQISYLTDKVDSKTFTASLYIDGKKKSECMLFTGSMVSASSINYARHISTSKNSLNESLSVTDNGYSLMLKALGMATFGRNETSLTNEGGAEYFWTIFIEPLQNKQRSHL